MSSPVWFSIPEFTGIQQQKDGRLLPITSATDARNMDTRDGNLSVAKGFTKYYDSAAQGYAPAIPGNERILKLIPNLGGSNETYDFFVVMTRHIYRHSREGNTWSYVQTFYNNNFAFVDDSLNQIDMDGATIKTLDVKIGNDNVVLICTGRTPITALYTAEGKAKYFGSGELYNPNSLYRGVSSYNSSTLTVTLSSNANTEFKKRALLYGVLYGPALANLSYSEVADFTADNKLVFPYAPSVAPTSADTMYIPGQASNEHVGDAVMYAGRLFAAADSAHPTRLYWSAVPGDGRTIEDWTAVDGSEDASGGYAEVGMSSEDQIMGITALSNQLIIWKKRSVWRLLGDRPSTFTLELVGRNVNFSNQLDQVDESRISALVYHDTPYVLTRKGLLTYDNVDIVPADSEGSCLKRFLETKNFSKSRCAFFDDKMYFTGNSTVGALGDSIVVFDTINGSYMIRDGFEVTDIVRSYDSLFIINSDRYIYEFEKGDTYAGTPIRAWWVTQPIDFGKKMNVHQVAALYTQITGKVKVTITGDYPGAHKDYYVYNDPAGTVRNQYVAVRMQTDQAHVFRFRFDSLWSDNANYTFAIKGGVNIKALSELKE